MFENNLALYGKNIASYPIKIASIDHQSDIITLTDVVSGQIYSPALKFELVDHDDQVNTIDNTSKIKIKLIAENTAVTGFAQSVVHQGVASFDQLILQAKLGLQNVEILVVSSALNSQKIRLQYEWTVSQVPISASFRFWKSGEVEEDDTCIICSAGTYSLGANKTQCKNWINNAVCLGGKETNVNEGNFRISSESDSIVEWVRVKSWRGEYEEDEQYPVKWEKGYTELLCSECVINQNGKYQKNSSFTCTKCPSMVQNVLRIVGIMLAIHGFLTVLILINIYKKSESQVSVLMRILTNYLQVISVTLAMNSNYPKVIYDVFMPGEMIGSSSESFVSFDWLIEDSEMKAFAPNSALFKMFLIAIPPIVLIFLYCVVWTVAYLISQKHFMTSSEISLSARLWFCFCYILH